MTPTGSGKGYWLAGIDGSVYPYGDAGTSPQTPVVVGVMKTGDGWTAVMSNAPASAPTTKPVTVTPTHRHANDDHAHDADHGRTPDHAAPPPPPPPGRPRTTLTPPATIDATGTRDVTAELQSFLNKVPHHATITFPAGARYRIEGTLKMRSRNDITINGNGATFFATQESDGTVNPRIRSQWDFQNMSNLLSRT